VELAVRRSIPFRVVVADSFYGEDRGFKRALEELGAGYVLALKPSHAWWHRVGEIGSPWAAAVAASETWEGERHPGEWVKVVRHFRDGHEEAWWALEVDVGPYGPHRDQRSVVATTDPKELPDKATWYLATNLPAPGSKRATEGELEAADLAEIVRTYGLRMWVEQSYKQVKHALGWSDYQVRSDLAIRRHWQLVCCAFSFCWWAHHAERLEELGVPPGIVLEEDRQVLPTAPTKTEGRGNKERSARCSTAVMAASAEGGKSMVGALPNAHAILESVHRQGPARRVESAA
jgi:hypothetical protein